MRHLSTGCNFLRDLWLYVRNHSQQILHNLAPRLLLSFFDLRYPSLCLFLSFFFGFLISLLMLNSG